ncbi:SRPBCC family protein [Alicyclobacillus ferrooxydans]|uniref:Carbon monoxide dehydrogenase n=1 Tax=Alicyclobacillus ferrooxydans TaxID=471514 RepID=A0A0P9CB94_9BACL|nr:carbon monoxide dehydrogenase subunit G [Alicyclobacillus ferrooxydans]KPV42753.1 carbon monoxide dehydrogenase [Alicyclobacillus ferrooxydans]
MQLEGTKAFPTAPMATYELITNPDAIQRAMPGLKELRAVSDTSYEARMEVGVAGIKGVYDGTLDMADVVPGESYRLIVKGEGPMGFMDADVAVQIRASDAGTAVSYQGEAKVGGTVAGVGQRMLSGVAKFIINQFFNALVKEAKTIAKEA